MNGTIDLIIKLVITAVTVLLSSVIVPFIKQKLETDRYDTLQYYVEYAVRCAEQVYDPGQNEQKKEYVYNYILEKSNELGTGLNEADIDLLVEGVVNLIKHTHIEKR